MGEDCSPAFGIKMFPVPRVLIREGAIEKAIAWLNKRKKKKIVVTSAKLYPLIRQEIESGLKDYEVIFANSWKNYDSLEDEVKRKKGMLISFGGGTINDMVKLISSDTNKEWISLPSVASHDGICSPRASRGGASIKAKPPSAVFADLKIISSAPRRMLASGFGDLIANYSALLDWKLAEKERGEEINPLAYELSKTAYEKVKEITKHGLKKRGVKSLVEGWILSGLAMCLVGSSRPASGSEHAISHVLDKLSYGEGMHGEQCGIASILTTYLHKKDWKWVKDSLEKVGAPVKLRQIGVTKDQFLEAVLLSPKIRNRYGIVHKASLKIKRLEEIVQELGLNR
jgi:glycerol-1-phosphate dehydrogenase [NAD(P)+]